MATKSAKRVRIRPELVPKALWGRSIYVTLRAAGRRRDWEALRREVLKRYHGRCVICNAQQDKGMVCHEEWQYDYAARLATLRRLRIVCPLCNFSIHLGRTASVMAAKNPKIMEEVIRHICLLNGMTKEEVNHLAMESLLQWLSAPNGHWEVEISSELIERYPILRNLKI